MTPSDLGAGTYKGRFTFLTTQDRDLTIKAEDGLATGQVVLDGQKEGCVLTLDAGAHLSTFVVEKLVLVDGLLSQLPGGGLYAKTAGNTICASQLHRIKP